MLMNLDGQAPGFGDSATLYAGCCSSDAGVQERAYTALYAYLYRVARYMLRSYPEADALAQDCCQIAVIRVHTRLSECREPAAFLTWSRRIAANVVNDEIRRRKRLQSLDEDAG